MRSIPRWTSRGRKNNERVVRRTTRNRRPHTRGAAVPLGVAIAMNLNESFDVSPQKFADLRSRIARINIDVRLIEESFIRGGGKGGQKINKTANCVRLTYPPLDIRVRVQRERRRTVNRFLALRELVDQVEMRISPATSQRLQEIKHIQKRKLKRQERSKGKYSSAEGRDYYPTK